MATVEESIRYDTAQAESALKGLADKVRVAKAETDDLRSSASRAEGSMRGLEDGAGKVGSAMGRLGGAADLLGPGLGNIVRTGADLADVLEVAGQAGGAAGLGLGSLLAILGPIAIAGGIAYAVLDTMSERVDAMTARVERAAPALDKMRQGIEQLAGAENALAIREGVVSGTMSPVDALLAQSRTQADQLFSNQRAGAGQLLEGALTDESAAATQLRASEAAQVMFGKNNAGATSDALAEQIERQKAALDDARASTAQARLAMDALSEAEENYALRLTQTTMAEREQARARAATSATEREGAKEVDQAALALEARADAIRRSTAQYEAAQSPLLAYQRALEEIAALEAQGALSAPEATAAENAAADVAADKTRTAAEAEQARLAAAAMAEAERKRLEMEAAARAKADAAAARSDLNLEVFSTGVAGANSLMSGDAIGAISSGLSIAEKLGYIGPYGAAAGAALTGVSTLGEQGADAIADSLKEGLGSLVSGVEELPKLVDQLPDILQEMVPALSEALVEAGPDLAIALVAAQAELLLGLPSLIGEALYEAFQRVIEQFRDIFTGGGNTLGERAQNGAVDIARVVAGVSTFGLSEVALGVANAATDGRAKDALYAGSRETGGSRSSRGRMQQDEARASAAWNAGMRRNLGTDRDLVQTGLLAAITRSEDRTPGRISPIKNRG